MEREEAKALVLKRIIEMNGCKIMDLAPDLAISPIFTNFKLSELVDEMVAEGTLLEFEYELTTSRGRLKSFLLPGTKDFIGARVRHGSHEIIF